MKKAKKALSLSLIAMIIFALIPLLAVDVSAEPSLPYLSVEPPTEVRTGPPTVVGQTFTVNVTAHDVINYYGTDFWMSYNNSLINCTDVEPDGAGSVNTLNTGSKRVFSAKYMPKHTGYEAGKIKFSLTFVYGEGAVEFNGTGVVTWLTFEILDEPDQVSSPPPYTEYNCSLGFIEPGVRTKMYEIDKTVTPPASSVMDMDSPQDGFFACRTTSLVPGAPTADFDMLAKVTVCTDVTCTDTSTPGPAGSWIVTRDWSISGPGSWLGTSPNNKTTRTFHCEGPGTVSVTLNVTNNFDLSDQKTKTCDQIVIVGAFIDVYTSTNRFCGQETTVIGKGPDAPCDALSPDVNVTLFANVTWNKAPVNHVLVAFEIIWEWQIDWQDPASQAEPVLLNETQFYRTAETDKDGIATIWFRVPTPCEGQLFGKWLVIAKAKVQDDTIQDTMRFHVGYLITLEDTPYTDAAEYCRCCSDITVYVPLKNIGYMDKWVTLVVTAYDDCDVPIGQDVNRLLIPGGAYCDPREILIIWKEAIHVPQWAYVGFGKIYVSAFTGKPRDCGIPYCPEKSTPDFEILYCGPCP